METWEMWHYASNFRLKLQWNLIYKRQLRSPGCHTLPWLCLHVCTLRIWWLLIYKQAHITTSCWTLCLYAVYGLWASVTFSHTSRFFKKHIIKMFTFINHIHLTKKLKFRVGCWQNVSGKKLECFFLPLKELEVKDIQRWVHQREFIKR